MRKKTTVGKNFKPLKTDKRRVVKFEIGADYYICFHDNEVWPCILKDYKEGFEMISIHIPNKGGYTIYKDEIGDSPEHAVENTVTL